MEKRFHLFFSLGDLTFNIITLALDDELLSLELIDRLRDGADLFSSLSFLLFKGFYETLFLFEFILETNKSFLVVFEAELFLLQAGSFCDVRCSSRRRVTSSSQLS